MNEADYTNATNLAKLRIAELEAALRELIEIAEIACNQDGDMLSYERNAIDNARAVLELLADPRWPYILSNMQQTREEIARRILFQSQHDHD